MGGFRKFLERNRTLIEIGSGLLVTVALGVVTVFISHQANRIAGIEARILEAQTELLELPFQADLRLSPVDDLRTRLSPEGRTGHAELEVLNVGGEVYDLSLRLADEHLLIWLTFGSSVLPAGLMILPSSYFCGEPTGQTTGLVCRVGPCPEVQDLLETGFFEWCSDVEGLLPDRLTSVRVSWLAELSFMYDSRLSEGNMSVFHVSIRDGRVRSAQRGDLWLEELTYFDPLYLRAGIDREYSLEHGIMGPDGRASGVLGMSAEQFRDFVASLLSPAAP